MDLIISEQNLQVMIPVIGGLISFILFWFVQKSERIKGRFLKKYGNDLGYYRLIVRNKYLGGLSMGVLPLAVYLIFFPQTSLVELGLGFNEEKFQSFITWSIVLSLIVIPLAYFSARNPRNLLNYPQIRANTWNYKMITGNLVAWAAYLLGYEILFRGLMLFPLVETIGLWPAITVNIGMYSATHIPKGLSETLGAIPLAIVLCLVCVYTGSIWIAFVVHVAMAWTNSITALKYNPEMKIVKRTNK